MLLADLVPHHNHLALVLPVLLKAHKCLLVLKVLQLVTLHKDLALQVCLRVLPQHLHQEDLVVPSNLVVLPNHLHPKDPELLMLPLDLKDLVLQAFLRALDQDSHLVDSLPLKAQASLKDLADLLSHFLPKDQVDLVDLADSQALVVLLKLLRDQVPLVALEVLLKLLEDQEHLEPLIYLELQVHLLMAVSKLLRHQMPLVVADLQAQVFHH